MNPLFDRYVMVDWSARSAPATGSDSIWIADLASDVDLSNPPTRHAAMAELNEILDNSGDERLLLGFDASLGYPIGTAQLLGLTATPWESMWRLVAELSQDDERNGNNRFQVAAELNRRIGHRSGPFCGCPQSSAGPHLEATKPKPFAGAEFRLTEQHLRAQGLRPASVWQLLGVGSVGSQTLTLLPRLVELRERHRRRFEVWPFTTGLTVPNRNGRAVVVAEVWPTMFPVAETGPGIPDAAQVRSTALALRAADLSGELAIWFQPPISGSGADQVVAEQGWVLGAAVGAHLR